MSYLLLTIGAFGAQALMFVPIVPMLVGTGALAAHGQLRIASALPAVVVGIGAGDFLWYSIGRKRGHALIGQLCRLALEPSTCLRRTERLFGRFGASALLFAKFVPGLSTVALPLAGVFKMRPGRFVLYDGVGVLLWVSAYVAAGYLSSGLLTAVGSIAPWGPGQWLLMALLALAVYSGVNVLRRRRTLREVSGTRISAEELHRRLDAGEALTVVDLRHPIDFEHDPYVIPGARYIPAEELKRRHAEIPPDRELVLYCTCPDEITSAREALRLRHYTTGLVRPLEGGLSAWRSHGFPVELRGPLLPDERRRLNSS